MSRLVGVLPGIVFIFVNTLLPLAICAVIVRRCGSRPVVTGVLVQLTLLLTPFLLGGLWFVGSVLIGQPPLDSDRVTFHPAGWFFMAGGFSMVFAWQGYLVVFAIAVAWRFAHPMSYARFGIFLRGRE